jgi:hypothetical protein
MVLAAAYDLALAKAVLFVPYDFEVLYAVMPGPFILSRTSAVV